MANMMADDHKSYDLVYVEWDDHQSSHSWVRTEDVDHTPLFCRSVGWRLKEDETGITLFGTITDEGGQIGHVRFMMRWGLNVSL